MKVRLSHLRRSSLLQITLLFLLFTSVMLWLYVLEPIVTSHLMSRERADLERANLQTVSAYLARKHAAHPVVSVHDDEYAEEIFQANPSLHYYKALLSGEIVSSGRYPQWLSRQNVARLLRFSREHSTPNECLKITKTDMFTDTDGVGQYRLWVCGDQYEYEELSGLSSPVAQRPWRVLIKSFSVNSDTGINQRYLYIGMGVFILAIGVMGYGYWSLRRLSKLVDSFSPDQKNHTLPTSDIPLEVVPLIEALNNLMARIDEHEEQHNFFLSTAAHEIRDPLSVLRIQISELPDCEEKEKVTHSIRNLSSLTNQLLTFLKVNSWDVSDDATDLVTACCNCIEAAYEQASIQGVELCFETEVDNWYIVGNEHLIELAITNVLKNAISFTPRGERVIVQLNECGVICVQDMGQGIEPGQAERLFEPFCKYPPNRNGHGLGLAIVKAVITLHQGHVTIRNRDTCGAEVRLVFFPFS